MLQEKSNAAGGAPATEMQEFEAGALEVAGEISPTALSLAKQLFRLVRQSLNGLLLNNKISVSQLFPWEYQLKTHSPSPICSKRIHEAPVRTAFSCFDCRECDNSILCYECFSGSNHDGHRYIQFETSGGCCDCGDMEAWSEHGFCKKHGRQTNIEDIDDSIKQLFCKEIKFAYFLYFWLVEQFRAGQKVQKIRYVYGSVLLEYSANLVSEQHQLKYLLNLVLQQRFTEFPGIPKSELTIIERFFQLQEVSELVQFNKISIELFPVEQFRYTFIKQYFLKTFKNEMALDHPLKQLNYQYTGRAKVISELIEKGELHPLLLDKPKPGQSPENISSLYKKYIDDFTYLIKPKSAIMYFKIHFERINICQMFQYRQRTEINENEEEEFKIQLDDYVLKIYAEMLKILKNEKQLLKKMMKELMEYIITCDLKTYSLIHERAFALTALEFLDGSLSKLPQSNTREFFLSILGLKEESKVNEVVFAHISSYLKKIAVSYTHLEESALQQDDYANSFNSTYPQRYLLESLDSVYIKIFIKLYEGTLPLDKIIEKIAQEYYSTNSHQLIFTVLKVAVSIVSMDIDEVIACDQIEVDCRGKFFNFLKRFLKSYNTISAKQLKYLAKYIINNDKLIDEFLTKQVRVEKGKIVQSFQQKPLEIFIYNQFFKVIKIDIFKAIPSYYHKIPRTAGFKDTHIFTETTAAIILRVIGNIVDKAKENEMMEMIISEILASFLLTITQIQAEIHYDGCRELFNTLMGMNFRTNVRKEMIEQANYIMNPKQNQSESPLKLKEQQDGVKKKEALMKKRKQKEDIMKKKQLQLLKNYENAEEHSSVESCIYCKQNNNIELYYVAYCNFTSIYEQKCLKTQGQHIFFQTCGHKIHQQCYEKYLSEVQELTVCFLCKRHVNILVPYFHKGTPAEAQRKLGQQFASIIYPILLLKYEEKQGMINEFFSETHQDNVISVLIESFAREVILRSLYDIGSFEKELFPIYSIIFDIIKEFSAQQLSKKLSKMQQQARLLKCQQQFKEVQLIFIKILQRCLLKDIQVKQLQEIRLPDVKSLFQKIITLFKDKTLNGQQLYDVNLSERYPIVSKLPEKIIELLPAKPQCGVCNKLSNRLLACLLCSWIGCDDDQNCMKLHAEKEHIDGSIFAFLYNGQIIYVFQSLLYVTESIYYDYLGESMSREKRQVSKEQLQKYFLDTEEFNQVLKSPIQHVIHQYAAKS